RRPRRVIQNDQATWTNEFPEKIEIHEDFVEPMAAIDEGRIGGECISRQARERDRGWLTDESGVIRKCGGTHFGPADVTIGRRLKRVDDDVRYMRRTTRAKCLTNRESGASVGQPDFDDNVRTVRHECVAQNVAVHGGQRHALEVAFEWSPT